MQAATKIGLIERVLCRLTQEREVVAGEEMLLKTCKICILRLTKLLAKYVPLKVWHNNSLKNDKGQLLFIQLRVQGCRFVQICRVLQFSIRLCNNLF